MHLHAGSLSRLTHAHGFICKNLEELESGCDMQSLACRILLPLRGPQAIPAQVSSTTAWCIVMGCTCSAPKRSTIESWLRRAVLLQAQVLCHMLLTCAHSGSDCCSSMSASSNLLQSLPHTILTMHTRLLCWLMQFKMCAADHLQSAGNQRAELHIHGYA